MALGAGQPLQAQPHTHPSADPHGRAPPSTGCPQSASPTRERAIPAPSISLIKGRGGEAPSNFLALKRFLRDLDKTRASCFLMCFTKGTLCQKSMSS